MTDPNFPQMSPLDQLRMVLLHNVNALGRGIVIARPKVALLLDRLQADRRLIAMMDRLHEEHQGDPVWTKGITGSTLVALSPSDCRRVLGGSDQTYAMATPLKRRMMGHFQPDGVILTRPGELRTHRRQFNEVVLDWGREVHREAATFIKVVNEEVDALLQGPMATGRPLTYRSIRRIFQRIGRRCVLGDAAAEDVEMSELLDALRREGNWLGLRFWRRNRTHALRARFVDRVHRYVELGQRGSLVGRFADLPTEARLHPSGQVAHWLMAFDIQPVVITRALALLSTHPQHLTPIEEELADADRFHGTGSAQAVLAMPYLRASVMEAARLWPVVRDLARVMARDADWDGRLVPQDAEVLISTVYHGRAAYRGRAANRFTPQQWIDGSADGDWGLSPASRGPAGCPGADLGFFLITGFLAATLRKARFRLLTQELRPDIPLPVNFDPFHAKFAVADKPDAPPTVMVSMGPGNEDYGED
ncbi:cytochrome P450 [Actinorhabdospora filicis]|uniref:Cytochrome P450 n=1 Tax=Actinorhabdospora filicis TaxID=1785913 RepID=A0A9W6SQ07_9ACTN|nr:cytochrome P450 [Actinorhabdospora filicis]GLZ79890.1 cytochrome P450 [Actinorhabdospora filicis]